MQSIGNDDVSPQELARSIALILKSTDNNQQLQMPLFELLGPESIEFIQQLYDRYLRNTIDHLLVLNKIHCTATRLKNRVAILESIYLAPGGGTSSALAAHHQQSPSATPKGQRPMPSASTSRFRFQSACG